MTNLSRHGCQIGNSMAVALDENLLDILTGMLQATDE